MLRLHGEDGVGFHAFDRGSAAVADAGGPADLLPEIGVQCSVRSTDAGQRGGGLRLLDPADRQILPVIDGI